SLISPSRRLTWLLMAAVLAVALAAAISTYSVRQHLARVLAASDQSAAEQVRGVAGSIDAVLRRAIVISGLLLLPLLTLVIWSARRQELAWDQAQRNEKSLVTTLRSIGDAVVSTDAEGRVMFMNAVAQRLTGWSEEQAQGRHLRDVVRIVQGGDNKPMSDLFERVVATSEPVGLATGSRLISKDGMEYCIDDSGARMREADGTLGGIVFVFRDVTQRDVQERALRASQEMFRLISDNIADLIAVLDPQGRRLYTSRSYQSLLGAQENLYLTDAMADVHPDDRERIREIFDRISSTGIEQRAEYRAFRRDGTVVAIESVGSVIRDEAGNPARVLIVSRDITQRKAAEEMIRGTMLRLEQQNIALASQTRNLAGRGASLDEIHHAVTELSGRTLRTSRVSVWFYNEERTAIRCADLFLESTGAHEEGAELRSESYPTYFAALAEGRVIPAHDARTDPRTREFADDYLDPLGITAMLDAPIHSEGRLIGVLCHEHAGSPREWTIDEQSFAASMADILVLNLEIWHRRQAEAALREARDGLEIKVAERTSDLEAANERLTELDRLKSEFLATMSHELRTPLNSIIGFTGILRQELPGPLNPEQHKQMEMVNRSAKHLLGLINDLLDVSRIESGRIEIARAKFDVREVVNEVLASLSPQANAKSLVLEAQLPAGPLEIISDRQRLFQILLNLATNAVKFTDVGRVSISAQLTDGKLVLAVRDTGIGIKPEGLRHLFEAFRQVDASARRQHEGTGLGLYLSRKLATLLSGTISAESSFGSGSVFNLELPQFPEPIA
ncbi:MAG: PAS domain S-box protein, partial [Chthoniobacteraceae bacterium]